MSQSFSLHVEKIPDFIVHGRLPDKNLQSVDLSKILSDMIMCDKTLCEQYKKFIANDQKILGQEKAQILLYIEELLTYTVTTRLALEERTFHNNIIACNQFQEGYEFQIYRDDYNFTINGSFSAEKYTSLSSFFYWQDHHYLPLYNKLLKMLTMSAQDHEISSEEVIGINQILNEMIHLLVIIHYKLEVAYLDM